MKRIKELFSKFINIKLSLKLRILSLFLIIILLAFSVVSYILTYSDLVIDFETDSNYRASGIYDDTVIVNDLESDYNYYMGLNYTTSSSNNTLPTTVNKNIYNDSNLVQVKITYSGNNYQDTKTSYVSLSELQNKYIYYKTYPVNNNNTTDTSDDYVEITLIDNPFTYLPNDLAFNFWITDYSSAVISYDDTYYERKVKIPITYTNNKPDKIEISFKTSYTTASVGYTNSSFTNAFSYLKDKQMTEIETTIDIYEDYPMNNYYHPVTINRNGDCSGYYNQYGTYQQNCTCRTNWWSSTNTCTYYKKIEDENFDINATYYYLDNGYMTLLDNSTIERVYVRTDINENFDNSNMAGFYTLKTFNNGDSITGYYDNTGNSLTGTCTSNTCSYYNLEQYYKDDNSLNIIDTDTTYYYLVTRDTNYIVLNETTSGSWSSNTKPFTLTSVYNGESYIDSSYWNVSSNSVNAYNDMKVQNIKIDSSSTRSSGESTPGSGGSSYGGYGSSGSIFVGNWHNVKFGRGIVRYRDNYTNFSSIIGGNSSSTGSRNSPTKYKLIIESGFYNSLGLSTGSSGGTDYIEGIGVYGSDYDRVSNNNSLLDIRYCASGSWAGSIYSSDNIKPSLTTIVKSGTFGSNKYDYAAGIYVGGRNSGTHYAPRSAIIEGGYIYNLIGGPLTSSNRTSYNDTFIYMKGGSVDIVIGGAGRSETYGNRIIQITGGVVNYSVFGGSNGIEGSNQSNSLGTIDGDTFVYIGGNAVIGDEELVNNNTTETESQVEAGSVFGIGNGRESTTRNNYEKIGSANNSNVIIDGNALIRRNVYAGGNFGAVGINSSSSTTESNIFIHGGIIKGSVYGGGNNNGSGSTSVTSTVNIEMTKGVINGSLYGGSNQLGTIYGSVNVKVSGGEISNSVYGGGQGGYASSTEKGTFVRDNISVTIGDTTSSSVPIINNSVYGGSAFGSVNGTSQTTTLSSSKTNVVVNKGLILNVFGGGEGDDTYTPYVEGDIKVIINDGTITNVYGGNDKSGKPNGNIEVYINGGVIQNTFGGGNQTSANTTNVYLTGGTSTNIYGGSNVTGEVETTNVITTGGTSTNVYGGNNQGGTTNITNVTINDGNITNVYGGGEQTSVLESTNVNLNNYAVNVFGGSNLSGDIPNSYITVNCGGADNLYGGNNQGGTTTTSNIVVNGSNIKNLYGGGLKASTTTSNIDVNYGYITNLYGGGSEAGVNTTNVNLGEALIENVFGGSNLAGDVITSNIKNLENKENNKISVSTSFSMSYQNQSGAVGITSSEQINVNITNKTGVSITTWDLYLFTSDGLFDSNWSDANVSGKRGIYHVDEIDNYYGTNPLANQSTYSFNFNVHAYVSLADYKIYGYVFIGYDDSGNEYFKTNLNDLKVYNLYGGNNQGGTTTTTNVNLTSGAFNLIYGGGNEAVSTTCNINSSSIKVSDSLYGGGNEASCNDTFVTLQSSTIGSTSKEGSFYGGGNNAEVLNNATLVINGFTYIYGNVYAGGNLGALKNTATLDITDSTISGSVYGGGNKAAIGSSNTDVVTTLTVNNITANSLYGGGRSAGVNGSTNVVIKKSTIENVYGGGNGLESIVSGDETGEENPAKVLGNTNLNISNNSTLTYVYGGGNLGFVNNNTNVILTNSSVLDSIYGGGNAAKVLKSTNLKITDSTISKSVFAGGNGRAANVLENTNLNIEGTTKISKHVFGGGNAAPTGKEDSNSSTSIVNITGAKIDGNVYGGANTSVLYGVTNLNIGINASSDSTLKKGDIIIQGTVFGGGEANEEGSEVIDFSFISVTEGITINIDGQDHDEFTIGGSIFGSGNASMTTGYSNVYIKNYGTKDNIKKNISLQRADLFSISNSYIMLSGAKDRTNEFSEVLFTLSRIDELKLKNNSSLYLDTGANLVKKFSSLVDVSNTEEIASVDIDSENRTMTRNVDNRLYMLEGKNLNIARNQAVTLYGDVSGMTFFGMYLKDQSGNPITALYDSKYDFTSTPASGDLYYFTSGSYVLGSHMTNHDIEVNGFYSNYANDEDPTKLDIKYIEPTPSDSDFYMWVIGEQVISYDVNLTASKYSTLGIEEFSFLNYSNANTKFSILGFNYANLASGVSLVPSSEIPRIASNPSDADNVMGLAIKTGQTGWVTVGETEFASSDTNPIIGTTTYESENSNVIRSFVFYLYHSKNLQSAGQMGSVTISIVAITPIDELNNEVERINFNVTLSRALYNTDEYEAAMTPGKKYEMFASSPVNITTDSSLSAYYSLYMEKDTNPYKTGYHRVLTSSYVLPVNTKITMIDYVDKENPIYYYYVVSQNDYNDFQTEYTNNNEVSINLSKFIKMGSTTTTNNYDDAVANSTYYNSTTKRAEEEFIFIVDFKESDIQEDVLNASLLLEIRNNNNQTLISVLGIQQESMVYNLYYDKHAVISITSDKYELEFYNGNNMNLNINTNFIQQTIGSNTIYDTNYYDLKLGLKISIVDSDNNTLSGTNLLGISYTYNGVTYYPRYDGTTRINIAPRVANVSSKITLNAVNSNLAGGDYKIVIESFGSPDGIYYGLESSDTLNLNFHVMDTLYGLKLTIPEKAYFIDKTTGKNLNDSNVLNMNIKYQSGLSNPNLRIKLYRRKYDSVYSLEYESVDLADYISNNLQLKNENEYLLADTAASELNFFLNMKENLKSGTYKIEVLLYDNDTYVGSVYQYIIIK